MGLDIRLLGVIEVVVDGHAVALGGPRQRRLLGHLALSPGAVRSIDSISAAVWPDGDVPTDPRQALRTYTSRLRSAFGDDLVTARDGGYVLGVSGTTIDAGRAEILIREAADPGCTRDRAVLLLTEAIGLWRGNALEGFEAEEWARGAAARLTELRARARDDRADALIALGRPADAVADLEAAAADSPLRERTHALLMTALHRSGRQAEALRVFQAYRRRLATDLGLEPGAEVRRIEAEIAADGYDPSSMDSARPLRGYLLGERIGDGSFAVVYRGTQPSVGRDVAIKVIRAELANRPEFIRRFEFEAHLVAHLEHPHIVPLYDYWREPGSAYLVMRLLRGGTLDRRLSESPLSGDEAVRLVEHIGLALAVAHRAGIVHRDVKPANVFLDGDGNFFLGDFGIALEAAASVTSTDSLSLGSPAYASPEQLRRQPVGPQADVHGLAITLYESLTGQLPFPDARNQADLLRRQLSDPLPSVCRIRPDLPSEVDQVLGIAAAKDPGARYGTIDELVGAFANAVRGRAAPARRGVATVIGELRNPYKGLRPFQEADALDFHGRHRLVDRLITKLAGTDSSARFLTVVGPSGSGKSSVVRAGLIPALRAGALVGSSQWFVTSMTPGTHPFEELERALSRVAVGSTTGGARAMASDRRGIARAVKQACPAEDAQVVVLVDQFEELFTLCTDEVARQQFIAGLIDAVVDPKSPLRVVATLRADFFDRPLRYPELAPFIEAGAVTVSPLAPDELDRAITEPALHVGADFEPGLVARIVADVLDQPGALPLLQYSLTELFDHNVSGLMTLAGYEALGGLSGALARRADQLYTGLADDEQDAARRVFTRLVTLGEGTEDTRRRVRRSELTGHGDAAADRVIDAYGAARLLAFDRDPVSREPTVEVAHEALIQEWPRLRAWLDDDRDGLRVHRHLTDAARAWEVSGRDAGELYRGGRLETAEQWAGEHPGDLNVTESSFVTASVDQREHVRRAERRSRRRIQRALVAVGVVAVLALLAGVIALQQRRTAVDAKDRATAAAGDADRQRAEADAQRSQADIAKDQANSAAAEADQQRDRARLERIVAESSAQLDRHLDLAMLLAVEAWRRNPSAATSGAMLNALTHQVSADIPTTTPAAGSERAWAVEGKVRRSASRLIGFISPSFTSVGAVDLSDDGAYAAVSGVEADESKVAVYDTVTRTAKATFAGQKPGTYPDGRPNIDFDLSPDGTRLLIVIGGDVDVIDLSSEARTTLHVDAPPSDSLNVLAQFTPDSKQILVRSSFGSFSLWDATTRQSVPATLPGSSDSGQMGFVGTDLSFGRGSTLVLWDFAAGRVVREVPLQEPIEWPGRFLLLPDESLLVGPIGSTGPVLTWDAHTGTLLPALEVPAARVMRVDPIDPSLLVLGADSGQILTYDLATGKVVGRPLRQNGAGIQSMATAPAAHLLATLSDDHVVTLWGDNAGPGLIDTPVADGMLRPHVAGGLVGLVSSDGKTAEIRAADHPDRSGVPVVNSFGGGYSFQEVTPSADGSAALVHLSPPNSVEPWGIELVDARTGAVLWSRVDPLWWNFPTASINADASRVVVANGEGFEILDGDTGRPIANVTFPFGPWGPPVISPDGRYVYIPSADGPHRVELADAGHVVDPVDHAQTGGRIAPIVGTADVVVAGGPGEGIQRWNMDTGKLVARQVSPDGSNIGDLIYSPDGRWIAAYHFPTGNVALFDATTLEPVGLIPAGITTAFTPAFTPDGDLTFDSVAGVATIWDLDPEHWAAAACYAAGRNLTTAEWAQYVGADVPYESICSEWPPGA